MNTLGAYEQLNPIDQMLADLVSAATGAVMSVAAQRTQRKRTALALLTVQELIAGTILRAQALEREAIITGATQLQAAAGDSHAVVFCARRDATGAVAWTRSCRPAWREMAADIEVHFLCGVAPENASDCLRELTAILREDEGALRIEDTEEQDEGEAGEEDD